MKVKKVKAREQTVVVTIQATYTLKDGGCLPDGVVPGDPAMFPIEMIDLNVCPGADLVEVKKVKVFETGGDR